MDIIKDGSKDEQSKAESHQWTSSSPKHESCMRCGGIMVIERFQDLNDETGAINFIGKRCVLCGDVIDPKIQHNRLYQNQLYLEMAPRTRRSSPQTMHVLSKMQGEPL